MQDKINLEEKFGLFDACWTPKILGEVNDSHIKIFKAKGEFVWHRHEQEDEFFLVIKGELCIKIKDRDQDISLKEGEIYIVPRGVDHMPYAPNEAHVLLFEKKEVINTGDQSSDKTVEKPEWI